MTELNDTGATFEADTSAPPSAPSSEAPEQSLEDALSTRFDELNKQQDDDSLDLPEGAKVDARGRLHGPDGKFTRKSEDDEHANGVPSESDEEQDQPDDEEGEQQSEAAAISAPQSWSAEMQEKWAEVPSEVQNYIAQREHQAHSYISQMGQALKAYEKAYEPINQVFERHAPTLKYYNVTPEQWVHNLTQTEETLRSDPGRGILWLADYYAKEAGYQDGASLIEALWTGTYQSPDPSRVETVNRLSQAEIENQRWRQWAQAQQQQAQMVEWQNTRAGIDHYAADKPDFDTVIPDIMRILPGLRQEMAGASNQQILDAAYEQAIWANPQTRAAAIARQQQQEANSRRSDPRRARALAATNVRGAQSRAGKGKSLDDELSAIYDSMN